MAGARLWGRLRVAEISQDPAGKFHRTIVMQIHGRLTDEQKESLGKSDHDAPPILKVLAHVRVCRVYNKCIQILEL